MLSGDNSILQKATTAKENTDSAQIKERIQLAELDARTDGKGNLSYSKLNEELTKEFGEKGTGYTISDEDNEIWTIKVGNVEYNIEANKVEQDTIKVLKNNAKKMYGKTINNYTAVGTEWQLYYADIDNDEVYIISKSTLGRVSLKDYESQYSGSTDVKASTYGAKWNSKWLSKCDTENTLGNAKTTAYLCDESIFSTLKNEKAKYAVGGPTIELFMASYNDTHNTPISIEEDNVTKNGYQECSYEGPFETSDSNGIYNNGVSYWIASPKNDSSLYGVCMYAGGSNIYSCVAAYHNYVAASSLGIRPIVCLPASAIHISGSGENATLSYE